MAWTGTVAVTPAETRGAGARVRRVPLLLASQIALGLLIAAVTAVLVTQLRQSALTQAGHELQSLSLILADQGERAFEAVDLAQAKVLDRVRNDSLRTPDDFRRRMAGMDIHAELDTGAATLPQLDVIGLIDADGKFINVSHSWPTPDVSIADRLYFKALKADPTRTKPVTESFRNRVSGTWAMVLGRPIAGADGQLLGVSFAGVLMSYFEKLYEAVAAGEGTSIALFRDDGVLLARYPHLEDSIGKAFGDGGITGRLAADGTPAGIMRQTSRIDGIERLIAGHALRGYPIVVSVSSTIDSILAPWRQQAAYLIGAAVLLEAVLAAVGLLMQRQLRGQRMLTEARAARAEAEAELALGRERDRAGREIHVQNARFAAALGNMSHALCMFDAADDLVVANARLGTMFGLPPASVVPGMSMRAVRQLLQRASNLAPGDTAALQDSILRWKAGGQRAAETRELADGRTLAVNFAPVEDDGWLVTLEDITARRLVEARIAYMAHHDALTGLPNRVLFHSRLGEAVARGRRGECGAVLCLDLDHFKAVNDTLGHPVGDSLLREVTARLQAQVRETDTVARLGGDEFAIVQSSVDQPLDATALARRVIKVLGAPYEIDGQHVVIGVSVGIAVIPADGDDADALLRNADMALYRAKEEGRGRYRFFAAEMDARMQARRALELDLRRALVEGEFEVYYQPQINLKTRTVTGFEALLRWLHPQRGLVAPSTFVPLAEEIGLIVPLGEWVLRRACADAMTWPGKPKVAVNLSPVQFTSRTLVQDVADALRVSGLEPARLELEITETVMLEDTETVLETLHQLRDLGVGIALDDFGTGYSSLSYLRRFPFSKVKIDRSFVAGLGQGGDCDSIVTAVVDLCDSLGITTTAEGVETEAQLQRLSSGNCVEMQGYLFSRPCPAEDVAALCTPPKAPSLAEVVG